MAGWSPSRLFAWAVPRRRDFARLWIPVVAWMILIFVASADSDSGPRGSRILGPLIRWLMPDISPAALERAILTARKGVHFMTFGILGGLLWRALAAAHPGRWRARTALLAVGVTALYAVSDEYHQSLVPSRVASALDVGIDTAGAAFVVAGLWVSGRWRGRW